MALAAVELDDKYARASGRVYLSGVQALVRLLLMQRARDAAAGLNTAGFVSGYRGSPLGGLDKALWGAQSFLDAARVRFQPGLNEDLAATAVWGSQQLNLFPGARYDGVYAMWYGKGPGLDRSGDVFKHANFAGTSRHGGVLVVAGDDHGCKSSTLPSQSEYTFMDAMMPVLNPAGVQEILDLGLHGWALSRYSGCWVGFKTIAETIDVSATVSIDPDRVSIALPDDFELPRGGVHVRWPDRPLEQEERLQRHRLYAALAFARANRLDRTVIDSPNPRFGIVTTGKSYLDVMQALEDLGIDEAMARDIGLRVYKVAMSWPLEREGVRHFAEGLEEILVVEEKRAVIENQLKEQLYNWREDVRPRVIGKFDEHREWILPSTGELSPARIARVIAARIGRFHTSEIMDARLRFLEHKEAALARRETAVERTPHFCAGCPHNTSTVVPIGSRATGGIGCHYMVTWMGRSTETFTQMGGEGVPWIGQAPFTEQRHVFANLGDGTYFHSGILAIRAAVAAGVNITYKILYNDAVAMTGGQALDGAMSVGDLVRQVEAEGVRDVVVVSDDPHRHRLGGELPRGVRVFDREDLDAVQRELRGAEGVTILVYEQTCAAEKRRRRKRGGFPDPAKRVFVNEAVCEGCGDCGDQSNCLAVIPVETELGRKRQIDQSACNKDFSCLKGFCPSFVTVEGGRPKRHRVDSQAIDEPLPEPELPDIDDPYGVVVTGIGGTGVVTLGALLGMAAHLEGKGAAVLDMTGLAQKYGAVVSHVRVAREPDAIRSNRIPAGEADLLLGADMVVSGGFEALAKCDATRTSAIVDDHRSPTAAFLHDPDLAFPSDSLHASISEAVGGDVTFVDAHRYGEALLGDAIAANLFLLGIAYQQGKLPVSGEAIERAIEINAVAVDANRKAFRWGRFYAVDPERVSRLVESTAPERALTRTLDELIAHREDLLTKYQNARYAQRYRALVDRVRAVESERASGAEDLATAVARGYAKLLAYKDEYEVARLYTDPSFREALESQFEGDYRLRFHLAPPVLAKPDPVTGRPRKRAYGPWMMRAFRVLARLKGLRGTPFDPFGRNPERRRERELIAEYESVVETILAGLTADKHGIAVDLASIPESIRGYGPVKAESIERAKAREAELLARFHAPSAPAPRRDEARAA